VIEELLVKGGEHMVASQGVDVLAVDIDEQEVELLPWRRAPSLINVVNITGINIAIAINAGSWGTTAAAHALQGTAVFR
jgi:hypothetical protein